MCSVTTTLYEFDMFFDFVSAKFIRILVFTEAGNKDIGTPYCHYAIRSVFVVNINRKVFSFRKNKSN